MDNSLWGALLGAAIALIAVFLTAKQTYKYNSKLEEDKLNRLKKEELFMTCELVKKTIASNEKTILLMVINSEYTTESKFDTSKAHPYHVFKMLINLYFPQYLIELDELQKLYDKYLPYYQNYVNPKIFSTYTKEDKCKYLSEASDIAKEMCNRLDEIKGRLSKNA